MRISTLPSSHPLNTVAKNAYRKHNITKHAPPLRALPRILNTPSPSSIEKISRPKRAYYTKTAFETCIPQNKDEALEVALKDQAELICYSDGSGLDGMAGAAAVLMRKDNNEPIGKVRYQLGTLEEHTTFDAESVGILLSLHLLQQHIDELGSKNCSASLDGKSVIEATQKLRLGTGQHIIEQIHNTARIMATKAKTEKAFTLA